MTQEKFLLWWIASLVVGCLVGRYKGQTTTGLFFAVHLGPIGILIVCLFIPKIGTRRRSGSWRRKSIMWTYTLNERGEPVREPDFQKWGQWFQTAARHVAENTVGEAWVSTVFLGLDNGCRLDGSAPVLWETMVFGGPCDHMQSRCAGSREQAEAMHAEIVTLVRARQEAAAR